MARLGAPLGHSAPRSRQEAVGSQQETREEESYPFR